MIDSMFNLLFKCQHRSITFPVTPVSRSGVPQGGTYVVCLDCGKQFTYDWKEMRIGQPVNMATTSHELLRNGSKPSKLRPRHLLWASVLPAAWLIGSLLKSPRKSRTATGSGHPPPEPQTGSSDPAAPEPELPLEPRPRDVEK